MRQLVGAVTAVFLVLVLDGVGTARAAWRWPVRGEVVVHFSASDARPFAAGRHRGISIAARARGVRSACSGKVAFAGSVGRAGPTVSVRCGALRATYQGLAAVVVRRGHDVEAGTTLGRLDRRGILRLGARREPAAGVHRYVDPLTLLREPPAPRPDPTCGACLGRAPRAAVPRAAAPERLPQRRTPVVEPVSVRERGVSPAVWIGLGLLALAVPPGVIAGRRRRGRRSRAAALAGALRG